ncbi:DUF885 family protein [Saccharicrinis sp. FJH2]|uniref:DUF885 domain-containing protein n=1 Tax=Saccharicrinis sp. FJH65 TaxID=3344659 RepID=UPI0035F3E499
MHKFFLPVFIFILFLGSCKNSSTQSNVNQNNKAFDTMLNNYYEEGLRLHPIEATYQGDTRYNNSFPNFLSIAYRDTLHAYYTIYLNKLQAFNDKDLTPEERVSKAVLKWECDINLEGLKFREDYFPVDQMWTVNLTMGQFASGTNAQPFKTVQDYRNWLERVDGFMVWMDTAVYRMKQGIQKGYVLPESLIKKIIPQMAVMANKDVENHLFYQPVKQMPSSFSDQDKKELTEAYKNMVANEVIPEFTKMNSFLVNDYLKAGRKTSGIWDIPNGEAYYAHQIKKYTTTKLTAEEIHQIGLKEVERITAEMEKVKELVGFKGDLKAFFEFVRHDKALMPYTKPQQVLDHFENIYSTIQPNLDLLFDHKPKTGFEIRQTEKFREKSASAQYSSASLDGTRPGIFYVPIPDASTYNIYSDEALFLHEAVPGHHYQVSLTQENDKLPKFRKTIWYSGYGEGWALYSESLGKILGLYTDPYQYFGRLSMEMHRAIRLVIDTGIHFKKWTRDEAIQYSLDHEAESEASIIAEVERYMANPGQALSYKIGEIKIRELRDMAKEKLGDKFDIRKYHDQVLSTGCVPLEILEQKINGWVASF